MTALRSITVSVLCLLTPACTPVPPAGDGPAPADMTASIDATGRVPKKHRATATACSMTRPAGPDPGMGRGTCKADADCKDGAAGKNGRCVPSRAGFTCSYDTCFDDATCGGKVCLCRSAAETVATSSTNHCLTQGDCQADGDCGAGGYCSPSFSTCGNYAGVVSYYCHTAKDGCIDDEDCQGLDGGLGGPGYCMFSPMETRWICAYSQCAG
jgi:hypothetical protein